MIYLPEKVWDMHFTEGGGYYFTFKTELGKWYGLRTWADPQKQPLMSKFKTWADKTTTEFLIPDEAVEVYAEDFRINWLDDGRIFVKGFVFDDVEQPPVE
jgi:hypothetical protein